MCLLHRDCEVVGELLPDLVRLVLDEPHNSLVDKLGPRAAHGAMAGLGVGHGHGDVGLGVGHGDVGLEAPERAGRRAGDHLIEPNAYGTEACTTRE